ncbi:hypothetical protein BRD20_04795 [Halobacteriales archaeon SW_8_65_20]|nr:MAG: hypothetical protein BRD20_04795 [Halobacteriales archaeon SW_8_65_20]
MATKMVRIDEDLYERIKSRNRDNETFSETIERLTNGYSLVDFANEFAERDESRWSEHKSAIEAAEDAQRAEMAEFHDEQSGGTSAER